MRVCTYVHCSVHVSTRVLCVCVRCVRMCMCVYFVVYVCTHHQLLFTEACAELGDGLVVLTVGVIDGQQVGAKQACKGGRQAKHTFLTAIS